MEDIYFQTLGHFRVFLNSSDITRNLNTSLEEMLKRELEGKCIADGYVQKDSIRLLKRTIGQISGNHFTGKVCYDLMYSANICNPAVGTIIKSRISNINKLGFLAESGPLIILVAKQFYENKEGFKDIEVGMDVMVEVIAKRFQLNDTKLEIIGKVSGSSESGVTAASYNNTKRSLNQNIILNTKSSRTIPVNNINPKKPSIAIANIPTTTVTTIGKNEEELDSDLEEDSELEEPEDVEYDDDEDEPIDE
jgi:DNA-directed RNA polymerase subunit E'/Rpb7